MNLILEHYNHLLTWDSSRFPYTKLEEFAICVCFTDCTIRPICRPSYHQRVAFNEHQRVYAMKFQPVSIDYGCLWSGKRSMSCLCHLPAIFHQQNVRNTHHLHISFVLNLRKVIFPTCANSKFVKFLKRISLVSNLGII